MKVLYAEGAESLVIADCNVKALRGEPVEVPAGVARKLLDQGWSEAKAPKPVVGKPQPAPKPTPKKED